MKTFFLLACLSLASCSIKRIAVDSIASSLAEGTDVYATEDDPQLVRDALPFALKTVEALLGSAPDNENLLLTACKGFTQYSYAFVQLDAERIEDEDWEASERGRARALKLFLRGRDYGLRALETRHDNFAELLRTDLGLALGKLRKDDVELLYWTASAWGAAVAQGLDRPELLGDVHILRALFKRALELDESWDNGAIHESMVTIESFPEAMGGSPERAREHFARALELSGGLTASLYISLAENLCVPNQDRAEFESLLHRALEIDPDAAPQRRLANTINQERARFLLSKVDDLFL